MCYVRCVSGFGMNKHVVYYEYKYDIFSTLHNTHISICIHTYDMFYEVGMQYGTCTGTNCCICILRTQSTGSQVLSTLMKGFNFTRSIYLESRVRIFTKDPAFATRILRTCTVLHLCEFCRTYKYGTGCQITQNAFLFAAVLDLNGAKIRRLSAHNQIPFQSMVNANTIDVCKSKFCFSSPT